jgi:hypothetical protein
MACRKGIASVTLERSETLRATGGGIAIHIMFYIKINKNSKNI